jgi:methyl-accepting chemotaxis protein
VANNGGSKGGKKGGAANGDKKLGRDPLAWMKEDPSQGQAPTDSLQSADQSNEADQQPDQGGGEAGDDSGGHSPPEWGEVRDIEDEHAAAQPQPLQESGENQQMRHQQTQRSGTEIPDSQDSGSSTTMANSNQGDQITVSRAEYRYYYRFMLAMQTCTTPFMMTSPDGAITYLNDPMQKMLQRHEREIAQANPGFSAQNLEGRPALEVLPQLRPLAEQMKQVRDDALNEQLDIGNLRFNVYITGEDSGDGEFLGNTLEVFEITEEWHRRENEKKAQQDIEYLIGRIQEGKLSERVETSEMSEGFIRSLSQDINRMLDVVQDPVREVIRVMNLVAKGDLNQSMEGELKGDFGEMQDYVNSTIDVLRRTVNGVRETADSIDSASSEISQGNQDLSQRTEEQASSLEETASSIEQLTSTVQQTAENARESLQMAGTARQKAEHGGEISGQVVEAMSAIKQSSREISDIITVIDEIAFQTNLLALNAAVEAARAGEHGRGFGVVAAEVRNLAQRSATAAKDIKRLIKDSGQKVEDGTRLVSESSETLQEIVTAFQSVNDKIEEIASATEEQSTGIDEINKAVSQLDEVTQQNASLVEEMASAAESLDEQSSSLVQLMDFFGGSQSGGTAKKRSANGTGRRNGSGSGGQSSYAQSGRGAAAGSRGGARAVSGTSSSTSAGRATSSGAGQRGATAAGGATNGSARQSSGSSGGQGEQRRYQSSTRRQAAEQEDSDWEEF